MILPVPTLDPPVPCILVVDDQEANIHAVGTLLRSFGCDVMPALSARQALQRLSARKPDLILLDMMMPGESGLDLYRRMKAIPQYEDIPVIFLSAAAEVELVTAALNAGAVDYVTKPFHKAELLSRVRTHLTLQQNARDLRQLAADKDNLLAMMAHDLQNRLAGMQMHTAFLSQQVEGLPHAVLQCARAIAGESTAMAESVREMLANQRAGLESLHLEPVPLAPLIHNLVIRYQPLAERKQQQLCIASVPEDFSSMQAVTHARALNQVLENLLSNAIKYSPAGATIGLSAEASQDTVQLHVADEGPGFTTDDLLRLFTRYGRLSARPTGGEPSTGLGLHIAHTLTGKLAGSLTLNNAAHRQGSVFTVRIPLASP